MNLMQKNVSLLELKRLLLQLDDQQSCTCIKVRLLGERWQQSFMTVATIYDDGALLLDEITGGFLNISDLSDVLQFEIDHSFQIYHSHFRYDAAFEEPN